GYKTLRQHIKISTGENKVLNLVLEEGAALDEVVLSVKSRLQEVQESSFNVVAFDAEKLHHTSLDITDALDRISGIKVKQNGGMGSDYNVMLNGFTGKHVKFFI